MKRSVTLSVLMLGACLAACSTGSADNQAEPAGNAVVAKSPDGRAYREQPLVTEIFVADPSAHVFNGKIYVYPSHDIDAGVPDDDLGNQYAMRDYRVLSMDRIGGPVTIGPVALDVKDVPWASQQMWAPDAAYKNGTYYLYFPARDKSKDKNGLGAFRIGVATSKNPMGPFTPEPNYIPGSFSIDPAVFTDEDGTSYMYFGGIWGGQLQRWKDGVYNPNGSDTDLMQDDKPALSGKVVKMNPDMKTFAEPVRDAVILDEKGKPVLGGDHDRRFFEAAWVFKRGGKYYYTYSTGDTHFVNYAIGDNPYGPFTFKGHILKPVQGWTSHHSIIEWGGKWWLFYHDTQLSGKNHLRSAKVTELKFNPDGTIPTIDPFLP
ncbi:MULTISPECIES: glycoside hydrolase family 43 protein [unclassified Sphingomonas]|uniref:glycoside hydrolase family 43 protein n=1 Tax=unclassified Sphingomonas TaxID=196159 RepID=UPI002151E676|nr:MULTISPECIES: glycoside hydrolase family 43 protein [unclassified Sphingomonas]MCR5871094.1 glycoside hydrolase family 43 protein [Sphingomonas sp. J344]UUY00591.1 glycoside hydrolase family 43 protein [Sphingomonas sp. J315]